MMENKTRRQLQKKRSRDKNNMTTMAISRNLKSRLLAIQKYMGFDKREDALEEVLAEFEDKHPCIEKLNND